MDETDRHRYARSFDAAIQAYHRGRPSYPDQALDRLTRTHPALAGRTTFVLPYQTYCFRAERTPAPG